MPVEWRPCVGYEGLYEVSNTGEVRGVEKTVAGNHLKPTRRIPARTKKQCTLWGYPAVSLFNNGEKKLIKVHRIVALAFLPNPSNYPMVNHIDNTPLNNHVENLEWCTAKHNIAHMLSQGRARPARGEKQPASKVTSTDVPTIRTMYAEGWFQRDIAEAYGISQTTVWKIVNRLSWKHVDG